MPEITKEVDFIRKMMGKGMYDVSQHANQRMNERNISFSEMEDIVLNHSFKLTKKEGNSERYEFYTNTNDKVIVALGVEMLFPVIVTVIKGGK